MDHLLRVAIWEAHGRRCAYTGDPLAFSDLEIDHVVPQRLRQQPEELAETLAALGLPQDFDLDCVENLLPSSGRANRQKGASANSLRTAHALELARARSNQAERIRDRLYKQDQVALARLHLSAALDQGAIGYSELRELIAEIEANPSIFQLKYPLVFADEGEVSDLTRHDVHSILWRPILPRKHGLDALALVGDEGAIRTVCTAGDWMAAKRDGFEPSSNYDLKEEAFFLSVAAVAWAISRRVPHQDSFMDNEGIESLELLSPLLLPHLSVDDHQHLLALQSEGESVGSILSRNKIASNTSAGTLSFDYMAMHTTIVEIMRGDFSGSGYEEILASHYQRALEGSYAHVRFLILKRPQLRGLFEFSELSISDLASIV